MCAVYPYNLTWWDVEQQPLWNSTDFPNLEFLFLLVSPDPLLEIPSHPTYM